MGKKQQGGGGGGGGGLTPWAQKHMAQAERKGNLDQFLANHPQIQQQVAAQPPPPPAAPAAPPPGEPAQGAGGGKSGGQPAPPSQKVTPWAQKHMAQAEKKGNLDKFLANHPKIAAQQQA